jgi:hypothetical protein
LDWKTAAGKFPAQYLTLAALCITLLGFAGYFFGIEALYSVAPLASIALHTVFAFCLLCAGIFLARPEWEIVRLLWSRGSGGVLARRMIVPAVLVPLLLGGLVVAGERAGLVSVGFGLALFSVSLIGVFGFLIRRFGFESVVRISLAFYNTREEIDICTSVLRKLVYG